MSSRSRTTGLSLVTLATCLVAACEHGIDARGTVEVPIPVQALWSPEAPAEVVVQITIPGDVLLSARAGMLCGPTTAPLILPVTAFTFGCAAAGNAEIKAWTVARPASRCTSPTPTEPVPWSASPFETARARAEETAPVLVHDSLGACNDGEVQFQMILNLADHS